MLDGTPMYFRGYHPIHQVLDVSGWDPAPYIPRRKTKGVKYYFIDFGISTHFAASNTNRLVFGEYCQDRTVPELSGTVPYDPFAVDVYLIGNALKIHVVNVRTSAYLVNTSTQIFSEILEYAILQATRGGYDSTRPKGSSAYLRRTQAIRRYNRRST